MDLGYWVQMCKAVDPPIRILFFLAQDLGQLNCWLKTYFPNGYVRYNMNWDFSSLISFLFLLSLNGDVLAGAPEVSGTTRGLWALLGLYGLKASIEYLSSLCIFIFYEAGKYKSYKALIHHLVHGLCADINMWRPNSYMGMGVIPTHNSHGATRQFSQPLCLCWGRRQLLWRNFYAILPLIRTS